MCQVLFWMSLYFSTVAQEFTVALAVGRVVSILAPFWHRNLDKAVTARCFAWTILIVLLFLPLPEIFAREFKKDHMTCGYKTGEPSALITVYSIGTKFLLSVSVLVFSNFVTESAESAASQNSDKQRLSNETNLILMMIETTCSFIILLLAFIATRRVGALFGEASDVFFRSLGRVPLILNNSLNVLFYSSTPMFRKALVKTLSR